MQNSYQRGLMTFQDMIAKLYPSSQIATKSITFVVTRNCDLKCTYCYECHKDKEVMDFETGRQAVDMLFKEFESEGKYINTDNSQAITLEFIGGEPLIAIDLMDYIVDYFKAKAIALRHPWANNYMISLTTNGIRYNTEKVQRFIAKNKDRVSFTITIDGNKELHDSCRLFPDGRGSYDIVEKAIKKQVQQFSKIVTKLTLAPGNVHYLLDAIKNLKSLGLIGVNANYVYEEGWTIEHAKVLYEQMKEVADYLLSNNNYKNFFCSLFEDYIGSPMFEHENDNWCGGTGNMLAIDVTGELYPCLRYLPFTIQNDRPPLVIGDVKNGIETTESQKEIVSCLNCITRRTQSTDECFNCPIAKGCGWCSAYNYDEFGTVDKRATYICDMHKARILANVYYWNKLYRLIKEDSRFEMHIPKEWALQIISEDEYNMLVELSKPELIVHSKYNANYPDDQFMDLNYSSWLTKQNNILFITGISGSGKSTLASSLSNQYNANYYSLDNFTNQNIIEEEPLLKEYADKYGYKIKCQTNGKLFTPELKHYLKYLIKEMRKNPGDLYIIEGLHFLYFDQENIDELDLMKQPMIILDAGLKRICEYHVSRFKRSVEQSSDIYHNNRRELYSFIEKLNIN